MIWLLRKYPQLALCVGLLKEDGDDGWGCAGELNSFPSSACEASESAFHPPLGAASRAAYSCRLCWLFLAPVPSSPPLKREAWLLAARLGARPVLRWQSQWPQCVKQAHDNAPSGLCSPGPGGGVAHGVLCLAASGGFFYVKLSTCFLNPCKLLMSLASGGSQWIYRLCLKPSVMLPFPGLRIPGVGSWSESFSRTCFLAKPVLLNLITARSPPFLFVLEKGELCNVSSELAVFEHRV